MPAQQPSKHGRILGAEFARLADAMAPLHPEIPERCRTCAFREGTIPNQMAGTLVEAMHCVLGTDPAPFGCHHTLKDGEPTQLCSGYLLARLAPFDEVKAGLARACASLDALP
jgi:hypothetical protein